MFARHLGAARVRGGHGMSSESGTSCSLRMKPGESTFAFSHFIHSDSSAFKVYCAFGNKHTALLLEVSCVGIIVGNRPLLVDAVIILFLIKMFFCT